MAVSATSVRRNSPHTGEILMRFLWCNPNISLGHDTASCNISDIISSELPSYQWDTNESVRWNLSISLDHASASCNISDVRSSALSSYQWDANESLRWNLSVSRDHDSASGNTSDFRMSNRSSHQWDTNGKSLRWWYWWYWEYLTGSHFSKRWYQRLPHVKTFVVLVG